MFFDTSVLEVFGNPTDKDGGEGYAQEDEFEVVNPFSSGHWILVGQVALYQHHYDFISLIFP